MNASSRKREALKRRIRRFYDLVNQRRFGQCFIMIDPRLLDRPEAVTLYQYTHSLREFLEHAGRIKVLTVSVTRLHESEPTKLYEGRDFALAKTIWVDKGRKQHEFKERWVLDDDLWYTRSTGFVWVDEPERKGKNAVKEKETVTEKQTQFTGS